MSITRQQLLDIGFTPAKRKRGLGTRKYDTLIYKINDSDYLYLGYNDFKGNIDYKRLWKSIITEEGRISYPVSPLSELTFTGLKEYIENIHELYELNKEYTLE